MLAQAEKMHKLQSEKGALEKRLHDQREELNRKTAEAAEEKRLHAIEMQRLTDLLRQANGDGPPAPAAVNTTNVIQEQGVVNSPLEVNPLAPPSQSILCLPQPQKAVDRRCESTSQSHNFRLNPSLLR